MEQLTVKNLFARDEVKKKFQELLGKRSSAFITSVLQIVSQNALLSKADPASIYHAAAVAATLDLPLNNNLGFAYIVPYNSKQPDGTYKQVAQFQMGYKGFIQLAQRSGQFRTISASEIYEGQIIDENPLTGFVFDFKNKKSETIIGYAAYFELLNGFQKTLYMSLSQINIHAKKYSQTFKKGSGLWNEDKHGMSLKTPLKLLLSKYAPLSIEMQTGISIDQGIINNEEATDITYIDNEKTEEIESDPEKFRLGQLINNAKTMQELLKFKEHIYDDQIEMYESKFQKLMEKEG